MANRLDALPVEMVGEIGGSLFRTPHIYFRDLYEVATSLRALSNTLGKLFFQTLLRFIRTRVIVLEYDDVLTDFKNFVERILKSENSGIKYLFYRGRYEGKHRGSLDDSAAGEVLTKLCPDVEVFGALGFASERTFVFPKARYVYVPFGYVQNTLLQANTLKTVYTTSYVSYFESPTQKDQAEAASWADNTLQNGNGFAEFYVYNWSATPYSSMTGTDVNVGIVDKNFPRVECAFPLPTSKELNQLHPSTLHRIRNITQNINKPLAQVFDSLPQASKDKITNGGTFVIQSADLLATSKRIRMYYIDDEIAAVTEPKLYDEVILDINSATFLAESFNDHGVIGRIIKDHNPKTLCIDYPIAHYRMRQRNLRSGLPSFIARQMQRIVDLVALATTANARIRTICFNGNVGFDMFIIGTDLKNAEKAWEGQFELPLSPLRSDFDVKIGLDAVPDFDELVSKGWHVV
jgi:hypothetical protein